MPEAQSLPLITVAVPTYNRSGLLRQTLAGLLQQDYPAERLEILVIDNNSPDDTRALVEELAARAGIPSSATASPALRYIHEPQQGLNHARNRAITEARGEFLILADDDILMEPSWARELCAPLLADRRGDGAAADRGSDGTSARPPQTLRIGCIGGEVVPVFPDGCPAWIRSFHAPLAFRSAAQGAGPIASHESPGGASLAFPRWVFAQVGNFALELDRRGKNLFGGGDTEMVQRIRSAGYAVWFAPAARVLHQMPASRTTFSYAARHAFDSARSAVVERGNKHQRGSRSYLLSRLVANLLKAPVYALSALLCLLFARPGAAKKSLVRAWRSCGYLYQISRSLFDRI